MQNIGDIKVQKPGGRYKLYKYCLRCGKPLKSIESRLRGYGDICYEKIIQSNKKPLFTK